VPTDRGNDHASIGGVLGPPVDLFDPAEVFHEASKLRRHREDLLRTARSDRTLGRLVERNLAYAGRQTPLRRLIARSTRNAERSLLPLGARTGEIAGLGRLARRRLSARSFAATSIELSDLAEVLRMTYGFSGGCVGGDPLLLRRPIPSPGGLYSLELYVVAGRVTALRRGLYHYEAASHELSHLRGTEAEDRFRDVLTSFGGVPGCAAYVIVTAVIERLRWKYGARAYRLAMLEVGHAGQQLCLAVTALGLVGCPIQAFLDDDLADLLGVDGVSELPLHVVGIGLPGESRDDAPTPPSPSGPAASPIELRSVIATAAVPELRSWEAVDREMTQAFAEIAVGRCSTARARLIALEARLGAPDATIRDYLKLTRQSPAPELEAGDGILLHSTEPALDEGGVAIHLFGQLRRIRAEVLRFLDLSRAPAIFVEHPSRTARPITLLGDRSVQRKVCLPERIDAEGLRHELIHAICAPPNVVIAEGLACLFASGTRAIHEAELHFEDDARDRLRSLFSRRAPGSSGGEALRDDEAWMVYPLAGSFVLFLDDRCGRDAVFRYASALILDGSEATVGEQAIRFAAVFDRDLANAIDEWWQAVDARRART
jgi:SagB-type dehydrogenase family enzyme